MGKWRPRLSGVQRDPEGRTPLPFLSMTRLMIIGGGRMGEALLGGLVAAGWAEPADLAVVEPDPVRSRELDAAHPGVQILTAPAEADGAILAVKPHLIATVARSLAALEIPRIVSIAAGVRLGTLEAELPEGCAVIRAMPNTPTLVATGATAIAGSSGATDADLVWAEELLGTVGIVVRIDESAMNAVTGLSGSGPAYVFLVAEALIEAGVLNGLDRATATTLASQTLLGAATMLTQTGRDAGSLRADVTSPGGTTAAGLSALEHAGVRAAFTDAVTAAARRATELG